MPTIAFMGVRISWLMFDRKSDFALFAVSAATIASLMETCSVFSSVTSRNTMSSCSLPSYSNGVTE